ncbi:hypothetical protein NPX13_g10519 [Xylaria arbuscula]|uniref:Methyltransferase type 11 domain-containing protein n=1 Tax=Xylaria arbuscula TaxID=114810 RepID=A0A9W8TGQ5_9PEZI|nr:hypothetical protein NPX13_g10519 [Xylaria arbuscula]
MPCIKLHSNVEVSGINSVVSTALTWSDCESELQRACDNLMLAIGPRPGSKRPSSPSEHVDSPPIKKYGEGSSAPKFKDQERRKQRLIDARSAHDHIESRGARDVQVTGNHAVHTLVKCIEPLINKHDKVLLIGPEIGAIALCLGCVVGRHGRVVGVHNNPTANDILQFAGEEQLAHVSLCQTPNRNIFRLPMLTHFTVRQSPILRPNRGDLLTALPFSNDSFDVVVACDNFSFVESLRQRSLLVEMKRVAKPGAIVETCDITARIPYTDYGPGNQMYTWFTKLKDCEEYNGLLLSQIARSVGLTESSHVSLVTCSMPIFDKQRFRKPAPGLVKFAKTGSLYERSIASKTPKSVLHQLSRYLSQLEDGKFCCYMSLYTETRAYKAETRAYRPETPSCWPFNMQAEEESSPD